VVRGRTGSDGVLDVLRLEHIERLGPAQVDNNWRNISLSDLGGGGFEFLSVIASHGRSGGNRIGSRWSCSKLIRLRYKRVLRRFGRPAMEWNGGVE